MLRGPPAPSTNSRANRPLYRRSILSGWCNRSNTASLSLVSRDRRRLFFEMLPPPAASLVAASTFWTASNANRRNAFIVWVDFDSTRFDSPPLVSDSFCTSFLPPPFVSSSIAFAASSPASTAPAATILRPERDCAAPPFALPWLSSLLTSFLSFPSWSLASIQSTLTTTLPRCLPSPVNESPTLRFFMSSISPSSKSVRSAESTSPSATHLGALTPSSSVLSMITTFSEKYSASESFSASSNSPSVGIGSAAEFAEPPPASRCCVRYCRPAVGSQDGANTAYHDGRHTLARFDPFTTDTRTISLAS